MNESNLTPEERLAREVENDFLTRQSERLALERRWQLNINFVNGDQYCDIDAKGEICREEKLYYWQARRVFNHIAPVIDTRLSKLARIRPALTVLAASEDEADRRSAALASNILSATHDDCDMEGVMSAAAIWSEVCGTAFYKIVWDGARGRQVGVTENGKKVLDGAVSVIAVSPFEIYPHSLYLESIDEQPSIIHAKALSVDDIYTMYGVKLLGGEKDDFMASQLSQKDNWGGNMPQFTGKTQGFELVIERYEKPTEEMPLGRLCVVAGGKLLYEGDLPYINSENGTRGYPFVKQVSMPVAGKFFGVSIVERLIPVQRAYNAVKNRKHEFLNRISMGTIAVEDGSVDAEEFVEEGLVPGKVIIYRQGSTPPTMLALGSVPTDFDREEEQLLSEFIKISGTGDLSQDADSFAGITSATGLQLILDQTDERLNLVYSSMKRALEIVGRHILRLYRQFATDLRLLKFAGDGNALNLVYFKGSDISSDDVVLDADSDLNMTPAQKRTVVYEILDRGLLAGQDGKLSVSVRNKLLETLGYGSFAEERDLTELNRARAGEENLKLLTGSAEVKDFDDHAVHINEHTAYLLSENVEKSGEKRICAHIELHKKKLAAAAADELKINDNKLSEAKNG